MLTKLVMKSMTSELTLLDSNILVYAYCKSSEKHASAYCVLESFFANGNGAVSAQNLAEFSRVVTEKVSCPLPFEEVRKIVLDLSEGLAVLDYGALEVADALGLCNEKNLHFYDALLVSTMEKNGIREIITEDEKEFKKIPWLKATNPFKQK